MGAGEHTEPSSPPGAPLPQLQTLLLVSFGNFRTDRMSHLKREFHFRGRPVGPSPGEGT